MILRSQRKTTASEAMEESQSKRVKRERCIDPTNVGDIRKKPLPRAPRIGHKDDVEDLKRLMKRKVAVKTAVGYGSCLICYGKDHRSWDCPCNKKIPPNVVHLGRGYDEVCLGCGKIGMNCCNKGTYAVPKWCDFCQHSCHWYWEGPCTDGFCRRPWLEQVWNTIKHYKEEEEVPSNEQSIGKSLQNKEGDEVAIKIGKEKNQG